ncbi:FAD-dependent monooxygenase [Saccharopolyspora sp. K220]|uniref:FAD-dependent oxidoreductase n=1 Tax=Saccharopolyspora soli TaxID=2926618 RepID=UPI001F5A34FF|nr:FAD-dependent oxidoreductase [Saccharopolyspora soli]MCI2417191.1 FAD-dependent monooxygenase [Saccharopolyspora soli]
MTDVLVVGGGPVGLLLASELRLAGLDPLVLEAADGTERRTRSLGLRGINCRSTQSLRLRGLTEPLARVQREMFERLDAEHGHDGADAAPGHRLGRQLRSRKVRGHFGGLMLFEEDTGEDASPLRPHLLKPHLFEQVLLDRASELGVRIWHDSEVVDVIDEGEAVLAVLADGRTVDAAYLVGCDGGRSIVRKRTGIPFPGTEPTMTGRVAVAEVADPDALASNQRGPGGMVTVSPLLPGEISTMEFDGGPGDRTAPVTPEEVQASIRRASGVSATVTNLTIASRYTDNARQAATYRQGRVLLAGDAAHVHSPIGGQGLNLGVQDAINLGWKLGLVVRGLAPESLLDTYTAERHPIGERVLRNSRAQVALIRPGPQVEALREVLAEVLAIPAAKRHFIAMVNSTDIDYAPGSTHPLVGRFMPDLDPDIWNLVAVPLRQSRAVLLDLADSAEIRSAAAEHSDRVQIITASSASCGELAGLLIRPDGYVAWACATADPEGLPDALTSWFGVPA